MAKKRYEQSLSSQDGKIYEDGTSQLKWYRSNGDESIVVGATLVFRTRIDIPKDSTIISALFKAEHGVKNGDTVPQSFTATYSMDYDSPPFPDANDVYISASGTIPPSPRKKVSASFAHTTTYSSNTPGADFVNVPITTMMQEVVNKPDYEPGQHITLYMSPTSEVGDIHIKMCDQTFAAEKPNFIVEYIEDNSLTATARTDVNHLDNPYFDLNTEGWSTHAAFNEYINGVSLTASTERSRRGGRALKVEATVTDATKGAMAYTSFAAPPNRSFVFCGWVYVPASNPNPFQASWLYISSSDPITVKDQWVPFCTPVVNIGTSAQAVWPTVSYVGASVPGRHFFVDDLMVVESKFMQFPFNTDSTDHRRMEFKNLYTEGQPSVVRKGPTHIQARVQPFVLLDDCNTLEEWTNPTHGGQISFTLYNGGVRANIPSYPGGATPVVKYMKWLARSKRYLAINSETVGAATTLSTVTTTSGAIFTNPVVQATEVLGSTTRRFYDIPPSAGTVDILEFSVISEEGPSRMVIYDIGESDRTTSQAGMVTSTGWVVDGNGLWRRTTTDRQSSTASDYQGSNHTMEDLENMGSTWDQLAAQ